MVETRIPDIPGTLASAEATGWLLDKVGKLCHLQRAQSVQQSSLQAPEACANVSSVRLCRFPGSQPVSFESTSLELLENEE